MPDPVDPATVLQRMRDEVTLVPEDLREWWGNYLVSNSPRYLSTYGYLERMDLGERVLEVGSTPGHFIVLLAEMGHAVTGVDIDPERIRGVLDGHGVQVLRVDVERESLPFEDSTFSTVLFLEILEHLRIDPIHSLREAHRVLKPGGSIVLSTPNITPLHRIRFLLGQDYQGDPVREFSKVTDRGHMGHIRLYSAREVVDMLHHIGFAGETVEYIVEPNLGRLDRCIRACHPRREHFREYLLVRARK